MPQARSRPSGASSVRASMAPSSRQSVAPSARQSLAPGTTPGPSGSSHRVPLPAYEAPIAPLSNDARLKLSRLVEDTYSVRKLQETLDKAAKFLYSSAGDLNEQLYDRKDLLNQRKRKRAQSAREGKENVEDDEDFERQQTTLDEHEAKIENMTKRLDAAVRKTIDGYAGNKNVDNVINGLGRSSNLAAAQTEEYAASQRATQASQRSQARRRVADDGDEADSDGEVTQIPATGAQSTSDTQAAQPAAPAIPSLTPLFTTSLAEATDRYTAQSLTTRYANHNEYVQFRKVVHDVLHPNQDVVLAHANTWFAAEEGREAPVAGDTAHRGEDEEDDDDIAIARVNLSTKCPLTLLEFVDPVTSTICKHSFERSAITEMIKMQRPPTRARGAPPIDFEASVDCPVAGCDKRVKEKDLEFDAVLVRQIKRIQKAKERDEGDEEEAQNVGSGDDSEVEDVDRMEGTARSVKTERVRATMGEEIEDDESDGSEGVV